MTCNQNCNQGRMCDCTPDVEIDATLSPMTPGEALVLCVVLTLSALCVIALGGMLYQRWFGA